ncbi:MAG: NAD(P)-dependent oxidoreductase [Actinobacteria bacterium]|nr:NAD(P)-dependent oxidoreductase [Actinomycetota bacterium]
MRLQDRRILLTGGNGFVGGRVGRALTAEGAAVVALVRRPGSSDTADERLTEVVGQLTDPDHVRRAIDGCTDVVHCAAAAGDDWDAVREVNRDGTRYVVEAAIDAGVRRLVHISTASVYDRGGEEVIDEDTPMVTGGDDPYAVTKAEAEREVAAGRERGLSATVLRPPAVLGWGPTSTWGQRVPERVARGELPFTPHPDHTHAWVHVDDLAEAAVVALVDDRADGRTYNVVGGVGTWRGYLDAVLAIVGDAPDPFADGEPRPPWSGRYDASRITEELGWTPSRSFDDGLRETARHWTPTP